MDEEQQNLELAMLHGWEDVGLSDDSMGPYSKVLCGYKGGDLLPAKINYTEDFNLIYSLEEHLGMHDVDNHALRVKWVTALHLVVSRRCPKNKSGMPIVSDITKMFATSAERCEAILRAMGKWPKKKK